MFVDFKKDAAVLFFPLIIIYHLFVLFHCEYQAIVLFTLLTGPLFVLRIMEKVIYVPQALVSVTEAGIIGHFK